MARRKGNPRFKKVKVRVKGQGTAIRYKLKKPSKRKK